ncbi:hypothetical protein QOL99_07270 [Deinococcus sp. MIMF12]|uniref:ABC transporter permease n=1 Tax=Deinococcus rhizophilus TaxID=3049544 RepID=A0ABT7JFV9_9DEIO|nr:hypothetical protein [Deinococcus rhizophilus]MDL2343949.1 hypothetical protein [Deinococcus rhizophilus]
MTVNLPNPGDHARLQTLTERYARFSASALGLGHLYGAAVLPLTFLLARSEVSAAGLMLWAAAVALGFIGVVRLTRRHYQTLGAVAEWPRTGGGFSWGLLAGVGVGALLAWLAERSGWVTEAFPAFRDLPWSALLALIAAAPAVFRLVDQSHTRTAGLGLLLLGGALVGGRSVFAEPWRGAAQLAVLLGLSLFLVWLALRQHAEARGVAAELREMRARLGLTVTP